MTRKKFIKQLMAVDISRNTATEMADAAARAELPLVEVLERTRIMRCIYMPALLTSKVLQKSLEQSLLIQARMTPKRIRPLSSKLSKKKRGHLDGLRTKWACIDELSCYPGTYPDHVSLEPTIAIRQDGSLRIMEVSIVPAGGGGQ